MPVTLKIEMAPLKDKTVTSRPVDIVNSVTGQVKTIDMKDPDTTFDVNPGEYGTAQPKGDVNPKGTGGPGESFSWNVPAEAPPPLPEPEAPAVEGLPEPSIITGIKVVKRHTRPDTTRPTPAAPPAGPAPAPLTPGTPPAAHPAQPTNVPK